MSFQVHTEEVEGRQVWFMQGEGAIAAICPALGFNCYRWYVEEVGELLYRDPNFFTDGKPTRSGIPVLFPFPNRIRDGRYSWEGKDYQLPLNDPAGKNAIHGFACRHARRAVSFQADVESASITGEFQLSVDAPEGRGLWPAECVLWLTYHLMPKRLRLEAVVANRGEGRLPFGLGYHPYFALPESTAGDGPDGEVEVPARSYWELVDSLPTGERRPVDAARDLTRPRRYRDLALDDVLTELPPYSPGARRLALRGRVNRLSIHATNGFREVVAFTPPHRKAVCLEPYTCTTDAINLQQRGVDAGLQILEPEDQWDGIIDMEVI